MTIVLILFIALLPQHSNWSQWGGNTRDFTVDLSTDQAQTSAPFKEVWKAKVGEGFSGIIVESGLVVSQDRNAEIESVFACDLAEGKEVWRTSYASPAIEGMIPRYGFGPHSTPCVANGIVCFVGGTGILGGVELTSGRTLWTRHLWDEFEATKLERGYSASPIYFDGNFILPVGGKGTGIVAFDAKTGKEAWRATDYDAAYSSPVVATLAGRQQLICLMANQLVSLNPSNGEQLWEYDYKPINTVHVASPLTLSGDRVFFLSSNLATMVRVRQSPNNSVSVEKLWESRRMTFQIGNVIQIDDQLIGPSNTSRSAVLTSINLENGQRRWRSRISGVGFLYKTKDGFITVSEDGKISLNKIANGSLTTIATFETNLLGRIWNTAAFAENVMLVRDQDFIYALMLQNRIK